MIINSSTMCHTDDIRRTHCWLHELIKLTVLNYTLSHSYLPTSRCIIIASTMIIFCITSYPWWVWWGRTCAVGGRHSRCPESPWVSWSRRNRILSNNTSPLPTVALLRPLPSCTSPACSGTISSPASPTVWGMWRSQCGAGARGTCWSWTHAPTRGAECWWRPFWSAWRSCRAHCPGWNGRLEATAVVLKQHTRY